MKLPSSNSISIRNASEHNLKHLSVDLPRNEIILVTGVSGSGKSSLVFDVLYREAEFRYLGSFSAYARQFLGRMRRPEVEHIEGLSPAIAIDQQPFSANPRSTLGTLTGIWDLMRLLYARHGTTSGSGNTGPLSRSLFSFNAPEGACPHCQGLGVDDRLDPELLIADDRKTLREGALVVSQPNGYVMYSQVTIDVLDQVCRAEGFNVDIPWMELTMEQKRVILYGSEKIEIPYGKHPLESRMKWTGITARPRELGYYKGILPVMENILRRDRNKNILRFVRTSACPVCNGRRLNERALSVTWRGYDIAMLAALPMAELRAVLTLTGAKEPLSGRPEEILLKIGNLAGRICGLGLGHLSADRASSSLSGGEIQRLRLAMLSGAGLSGMIYILDEPSAGLHPYETAMLIDSLKCLRDQGNTVVVVEHNEAFVPHAGWMVDIGPGPGIHGGKVLFSGPPGDLLQLPEPLLRTSATFRWLKGWEKPEIPDKPRPAGNLFSVEGVTAHGLKEIDAEFHLHAVNVITGPSGSGKSTLLNHILAPFLRQKLHQGTEKPGAFRSITGWEPVRRLVVIDPSPIGRTPRSNPATYTGLFDIIRDLYASLPESKGLGLTRSHFSFNTAGGRCETCEGAGYRQIGMHFMGPVEVPCETCNGERFDRTVLSVTFRGMTISQALDLTIEEAAGVFRDHPEMMRYLQVLTDLGLGYLTLGQRSSTLSGGESRRLKLAAGLVKPSAGHTLFLMEEPSSGLHASDVARLASALHELAGTGHTVICTDHHPVMLSFAGHLVTLGSGLPEMQPEPCSGAGTLSGSGYIRVTGATTHNLKKAAVQIPHNRITVITGVSGSGKSSLAFDTIFAESRNRFLEHFSPYARTLIGMKEQPGFETITGLTPAYALEQDISPRNPRSTIGTSSGIYDLYRLLFSRVGVPSNLTPATKPSGLPTFISSSLFSFNHQQGACPVCDGLGVRIQCDPEKLVTHPDKSILDGAMDGTRTGKFYGEPFGQYMAVVKAMGERHGMDFSVPWNQVSEAGKRLVVEGAGEEQFDVAWSYQRNKRTGTHHFKGAWKGLIRLVEEEYARKQNDRRGEELDAVMTRKTCSACSGTRLNVEALTWLVGGMNIAGLSALSVEESIEFLEKYLQELSPASGAIAGEPVKEAVKRLRVITSLGLGYLNISRSIDTLSAGEERRIRLAGQIGSGLTGLTYILDEPAAGLHPLDVPELMQQIRRLRDRGNTVILVEHDPQVMSAADHLIELGPGAGRNGGQVMFAGTPTELAAERDSVTGRVLAMPVPEPSSSSALIRPGIRITGACANNLKGFDVEIPLGGIIGIEGRSGSGKSSLVFDVLHASWQQGRPVGCWSVEGLEKIRSMVVSGAQQGFRSAQSVPATWLGMMDPIRNLFARSEAAVRAGFSRNHFSFVKGPGVCPACGGTGERRVSMDFLPDAVSDCEECGGSRYRREILEVTWNGRKINEVLTMTVEEALPLFEGHPGISGPLLQMIKAGLGYLQPGQPLNTLSGGEARRIQLCSDILMPRPAPALYLFDEPSSGLHHLDTLRLLEIFRELVALGHTLVLIEHDPCLLACCNHRIILGPGGGERGGYLLQS